MVFASYDRLKTAQHLHLSHPESSKRASERPQGALYESKMLVQDFSGFLELSWALVASLELVFGGLLGSLGGLLGALFGTIPNSGLKTEECQPLLGSLGALLGCLKVGFIEVKRWVMKKRN